MTVKEFYKSNCPKGKVFILRHDFDKKPENCDIFFKAERELNVKSTTYVRVANNDYNPFSYLVYPKLKKAEDEGFEIGLHSNFVEYAKLTNTPIKQVLESEWKALSPFYNIEGMSCHRDMNYVYNSLPWVEENMDFLKQIGNNVLIGIAALVTESVPDNTKYLCHSRIFNVELSGDDNKLHINEDYSSQTSFKKPVVHGMLGASFISTIIGTKLPGDGALWFSQSIEFSLPVIG